MKNEKSNSIEKEKIMKSRLVVSIVSMIMVLVSFTVEAKRDCFENDPKFSVDGKVVWDGNTSTEEIFEQATRKEIPNAKRINKEGILLADLIAVYTNKGTLFVRSCGKNAFTAEVEDLLSKDKTKSGYYLAMTKKKTFKIIYADGVTRAKSEMKRVSSLDLVTK